MTTETTTPPGAHDRAIPSDLAAAVEAVREQKPTILTVQGENADTVALLAPDRMRNVHFASLRHATPSTATGESAHQTMESLIAHVARHKDGDSVAWLNVSGASASLRVVYDYHRARSLTINDPTIAAGGARWCERTASYVFPVSPQWKAWLDVSGKAMSQSALAAFLEGHITELRDRSAAGPRAMEIARALVAKEDDSAVTDEEGRAVIASPSQLLRMARKIAMEVNTYAEESRDAHGNVSVVFRHEATAAESKGGVKTDVVLPLMFVVEVPVLTGGAPYLLPVRLAVTPTANQRVTWTLTVHRADLAMEDAINDASVAFAGATGLPVFRGTAEPAPTAK